MSMLSQCKLGLEELMQTVKRSKGKYQAVRSRITSLYRSVETMIGILCPVLMSTLQKRGIKSVQNMILRTLLDMEKHKNVVNFPT